MFKKIFLSLIVLLIFLINVGFVFVPHILAIDTTLTQNSNQNEIAEGEVVDIVFSGKESFMDELVEVQELKIKITKGQQKGQEVVVKNSAAGMGMVNVQYQQYKIGDKLKMAVDVNGDNKLSYSIDGKIRRNNLFVLTLVFVLTVIAIGKIWGLLSILGLITSFLVIFKFIIPSIIRGMNPMLAAVIGSIIIIPTTFYISHGFNKKTHVGVVSTVIALIITGLLAIYFVDVTNLTGFASEEAGFLQVERQGTIDIRGLLLAGIIIGTLGILDDVTIGQASAVQQLKKANKKMSLSQLFYNGMKIGQDHISSMVNTLVLVYTGSALPLLLLFFGSNKSFIDVIEFELIAEEIVRMLTGSIGLVLAAPLATAIAAYVFNKQK